jgi:hypothetical protein
MSKMAEQEYETRMAADQPRQTRNRLREAAQAVIDRWESPQWTHESAHTGELIAALRKAMHEAMREEALNEMQALTSSEYQELAALTKAHRELDVALDFELWGIIQGSPGGRWVASQLDPVKVYPIGTSLYVCRMGQE